MSTYVAGFDGHTCCNCGQAQGVHAADGVCPAPSGHCLVYVDGEARWVPGSPSPLPNGVYLARELLDLVQRNRWWVVPDVQGVACCRACGGVEGVAHHPACRYVVLLDQIAVLP